MGGRNHGDWTRQVRRLEGLVEMKLRISIICACLAVLGMVSPNAHALWNGWNWYNPYAYKYYTNNGLNFRPRSSTEKTLVVQDYNISKTPVNVKGINAGVTKLSNGTAWAYRNITIKHCEISYLTRTSGYHSDFIRLFGGGSSKQDVPTTVLIEDVYVHDGDVLPLIIQDGNFDKVTLRHWRHRNVATSVKLVTVNTGNIDAVYIQDSPGITVSITGRPGSIKYVYVKNCPGSKIQDTLSKTGKTGCKIIYQ